MKKQIRLKKNEEHRIIAGHQWIFSNEIASIQGNPTAGDVVELIRHDGHFLGLCFFQPHSLISARLLTKLQEDITSDFFERRILQALTLRRKLYPNNNTFRLVHGESDFLPGLIIDKYNEYLVVQSLTTGIEVRIDLICNVLESIFHPKAIIARNDTQLRSLENLPIEKKILRGNPSITIIDDDNIKYEIDILEGQKTGFYLDQRENRKAIHRYTTDANVLDCFCNEGGFALHACFSKARSITGIDISENAIAKAKANMRLNSMHVQFEVGDVFDKLKTLNNERKYFDVIILDPPSFTKNKKNVPSALKAYKEINHLAIKLLEAGGFLITSSCSHHIDKDNFLNSLEQAALKAKRPLQILEIKGAAPDHPVLPNMPETEYLKFVIAKVL